MNDLSRYECIHGQLKRSCHICVLEGSLASAYKENKRLRHHVAEMRIIINKVLVYSKSLDKNESSENIINAHDNMIEAVDKFTGASNDL